MATDGVPLACVKCGSDNFSLTFDIQPDDPIVCRGCRAIFSYAEAQQEGLKRKRGLAAKRGREAVI